jgi:uncharacterized protein (DUF2147 family)
MRHRDLWLSGAILLLTVLQPLALARDYDWQGLWMTDDQDAVIDVASCGDDICGTLIAFDSSTYPRRDQHNPQHELRLRPVCGLRVLGGRIDAGHRLLHGWVYDASEGRRYQISSIRQRNEDTLVLALRIAFFTHDIVFHRVKNPIVPCALAVGFAGW